MEKSSYINRHTRNPFDLFQIYKANVSDVIDIPGLPIEEALVDLKKKKESGESKNILDHGTLRSLKDRL